MTSLKAPKATEIVDEYYARAAELGNEDGSLAVDRGAFCYNWAMRIQDSDGREERIALFRAAGFTINRLQVQKRAWRASTKS